MFKTFSRVNTRISPVIHPEAPCKTPISPARPVSLPARPVSIPVNIHISRRINLAADILRIQSPAITFLSLPVGKISITRAFWVGTRKICAQLPACVRLTGPL